MRDSGIKHPAAGQVATQPTWRKPRPPRRDRRRAATVTARKRHPGAGERKLWRLTVLSTRLRRSMSDTCWAARAIQFGDGGLRLINFPWLTLRPFLMS